VVAYLDNDYRDASVWYSEPIPVQEDAIYLHADWVRTEGDSRFCLGRGWHPLSQEDFYNYLACGQAPTWTHYAGLTRPLPGATETRLWLVALGQGGRVYFDDVLFVQLDLAPLRHVPSDWAFLTLAMPYKVMFVHYGGNVGGAPISMLQLAAALNRQRFTPEVIFTKAGPILGFARELGVPARVVNLRSAFFYSAHVPIRLHMLVPFLLYFWPTVRAARQLALRERPDLVHLNTSVLIPVAIGMKQAGVPLVWHIREVPGPNPWLRRWQTGIISRLADSIIANSTYVQQAFPTSARVHVIHNALDLFRFQIDEEAARSSIREALGLLSAAPVVLMIGSVQAIKGHYLLVEAARNVGLNHPDARFVIVAGSVGLAYARSWRGRVKSLLGLPFDNVARMQQQIQQAGLSAHFVFTGYRRDIPELLAASDVVAFLPQAPEGFGRPLIEAMAAGRPVVATDIGPSREILGERTGLLVPPGDANAVAEAISTLLADPPRRKTMGAVGRQRAKEHFSMEQHVARVTQLYEHVLAQCHSLHVGEPTSVKTYAN
jgi:glycosyltransferase involved in cell wall biosynthesis